MLTEKERLFIEKTYSSYSEMLNSRAYRITGDYEASTDIVHDCIISTMKHIHELMLLDERKLKAYLTVTVDNLSKNYVTRHKKRVIPVENSETVFSDSSSEDSPQIIAEKRIEYEYIIGQIKKMNRRDRMAIELKYLLNMRDRDIAPLLKIQENSVRMTVRRSMFRLKKQLGIIRKHEPIQ